MLGFARRFVFFRKLLDREDLRAHVIRRGRYKTAGDPVRTDSLDSLNREQYEAFYGEVHRRVVTTIASSLGKTQQDVEVLVAGHILPAEQAVEHGWMTEVATVHEVARRLEDEKRKERRLKLHGKWGRGPRVALLFLDGAIWSGESRRHPLWGSTSGDRSLAGEIRKLAKDKRTKAVVLRVNSPGGSAVASESVRRELSYLREKKPLAVSMANVAGSGGYWVSVEGERIFAEGLTLTGSIGVIMVLLEGESALKRRGITSDVVRTGPHAEIGSPFRRATSEEQHILDTRVEQFYQDFLSRVANARNRTKEAIEEVAAGRVWSGTAAREASLVDEVGGIDAALSYLGERLGAKRLSVRVHPEVKRSLVERFVLRNIPRTSATGEPGMAEPHGGAVFPIGSLSPATFAAAREAVSELQGRVLAVVPESFFEGLAPRG
jgi:protease-4